MLRSLIRPFQRVGVSTPHLLAPTLVLVRGVKTKDPYAEMEATDQEKIKSFLESAGAGQYADKFKNWEHLMMSRRQVLKHVLEIPVKDRKLIRRKVHTWKLNNYYKTGEIWKPTLVVPAGKTVIEDLSSSDDEVAFNLPDPDGTYKETHIHYPGATRRENKVHKMPEAEEMELLQNISEDEDISLSSLRGISFAGTKVEDFMTKVDDKFGEEEEGAEKPAEGEDGKPAADK